MLTRHLLRRAALPAAALIPLLAFGPTALAGGSPSGDAAKKKKTALKDGRYTFKLSSGLKGTVVISGSGKKVRFSVPHFGGGFPTQFPYCQRTVVDHGTYTLKPDYVVKTELAWKDTDLYVRKAPAVEPDGSAGGGMSASGTIDPKTLRINGEFPIRLQDVAGGINSCFEAPVVADGKLVRVKK